MKLLTVAWPMLPHPVRAGWLSAFGRAAGDLRPGPPVVSGDKRDSRVVILSGSARREGTFPAAVIRPPGGSHSQRSRQESFGRCHSDSTDVGEWSDPDPMDDKVLLDAALGGDQPAYTALVERYHGTIFRTALNLLGDSWWARDATQEAFLRMHRYLDRFDRKRALAPWLYKIAVNVCREMRRRQQRERFVSLSDFGLDSVPDPNDPDRQVDLATRREMLRQGLQILPPKEREAIVLREIGGLSTAQVAEVLQSSQTTVRSQICRGVGKLTDYIRKRKGNVKSK